MGKLEASVKIIFNDFKNCFRLKHISLPTGKLMILIFILYALFIFTSNFGIAQQLGKNMIPVSSQDKFTPIADTIKSQLTESQKKISSDIIQLINTSLIPKGQSQAGLKSRMEASHQLISASNVMLNAPGNKPTSDLVYVYIYLNSNSTSDSIIPFVYNITDIDENNHIAVAWVELDRIEALASINTVRSVQTVIQPKTNMGSVMTEGDAILRSNLVRSSYGYNGSGVKVGVISSDCDGLAQSQATGNLPSTVQVLSNSCSGGHDGEGTAMMEIIYDMAPGAQLYFKDCGNNEVAFNSAIDALIASGCTVIVDDISWLGVPYFADGIIASKISNIVNNQNIIYISAAGNYAKGHYQGLYYNDGYNYNDFSRGSNSVNKYIYYDVPPRRYLRNIPRME
jgi:hypothetical protein